MQPLVEAHVNVLASKLLVADSEQITSHRTRATGDVSRCCATKPAFQLENRLIGDQLLTRGKGKLSTSEQNRQLRDQVSRTAGSEAKSCKHWESARSTEEKLQGEAIGGSFLTATRRKGDDPPRILEYDEQLPGPDTPILE